MLCQLQVTYIRGHLDRTLNRPELKNIDLPGVVGQRFKFQHLLKRCAVPAITVAGHLHLLHLN
jgi:hypothetical protein